MMNQPTDNPIGNDIPMNNSQSELDTNFDAGVEANSDSDPKKYIQQLSGKLSQELRKYNQNQQQPDSELNKYVAGMIIPQAAKALTGEDKTEVINKLENGDVDNTEQPIQDTPNNDMDFSGGDMPMESVKKKDINEIIDGLIDGEYKRGEKKITNNKIKQNNPFISNR